MRVTDGFTANTDDLTCQVLVLRARALREQGLNDGVLAVIKEALKSKKRDSGILRAARYERAPAYEGLGRKAQARRDLE